MYIIPFGRKQGHRIENENLIYGPELIQNFLQITYQKKSHTKYNLVQQSKKLKNDQENYMQQWSILHPEKAHNSVILQYKKLKYEEFLFLSHENGLFVIIYDFSKKSEKTGIQKKM